MLERKVQPDKVRKPSSNSNPKTLKFYKILPNAEIVLPLQLQQFLSEGHRLTDNANKIRVVLKINECSDTPSCLAVNKNQNCVGVIDPTPSRRSQTSNTHLNLFHFDSILADTDSRKFLFADALIDPLLDFIRGKDSCVFSFGHSGLGKTKSMVGFDQSIYNIGIIPCALMWTFKLIDDLKKTTTMRYSVRISAIEVTNSDNVRNLLVNSNALSKTSTDQRLVSAPGQEKSNSILSIQREFPANNLLEAAQILDKALATRSTENESLTHMLVIIHLYQYRGDAAATSECSRESKNVVKVSRLSLLDLGSGRHGNEDQKNLSLQGMSKVILALFTSQRHVPYKENVLTQLLKETLNPNISTTMLLHISSKEQNYNDTLQVVQLACKLYRMRLKKHRSVGLSVSDEASSCSSSSSGLQSRRLRPHMGIGAARRSSGNSSASSDFDLTSASELSCCETVIFKGDIDRNLSDRSPDRMSSRRKLKSVSSESDNAFSDKDSMKSCPFSTGNVLSPSIIRRRRTSPRTNALAWPSSSESTGNGLEGGSELWVDGPNAVYKEEKVEIEQKCIGKPTGIESISTDVLKPIMISKETQCDDVWDSGSSITDGSSHSNTLDRKDHRPLSDISECTEETESNLTVESELVKMNMVDQIEPSNDLDDFLESSFGLNTVAQGNQYKSLGQVFLNSQFNEAQFKFLEKITKPTEPINAKVTNELGPVRKENPTTVEPVIEKPPPHRHSSESKKRYHSAGESRRSTKSDNKEKNHKKKCTKCSRKDHDSRSKSMTSSSSTDFSRVTSWIENVEYESQSSKTDKQYFINNVYYMAKSNRQMHHHSQPNISYRWDNSNRPNFNEMQCNYQFPSNNQWLPNDSHQAQYALYDGYKMTIQKKEFIPVPSLSGTNTFLPAAPPAIIQNSSAPHMVIQHDPPINRHSQAHSPISRKARSRLSNISLPTNSVSVNQLPLPPIPKSALYVDTRVPSDEILNHSFSFNRPLPVIPAPIRASANGKCKTLPRDMYSEIYTIERGNPSDPNPPKTPQCLSEFKLKDKSKKDSNKFSKLQSFLLKPFKSLLKKNNKNKTALETCTARSEPDNELFTPKKLDSGVNQLSQWSSVKHKPESNMVLSSPYNLVTQPKTTILPTESSSHGSDSSSVHKRELLKSKGLGITFTEQFRRHKNRSGSVSNNSKNLQRQRPTSSGYGSIIIKGDSEVSSHNDSSSEYSLPGLSNCKGLGGHSRMKHSISLYNNTSNQDTNSTNVSKNGSPEFKHPPCPVSHDAVFSENVKIAENLIVQEKLKTSLKEERNLVIDLIEVNRLRGVPTEAYVMNLICFQCVDNFQISSPSERKECEQFIVKTDQEIELLKQKLSLAQRHLFLITSFDSSSQLQ